MPLKLSLAKGEKMVVNGAVIRNDGTDANIVFENQANILRHKDILTTEKATTPASRVYLALQCAYMFAAEELVNRNRDVFYFPSYEQVTVCTKEPFWHEDQRHVSDKGVAGVMRLFDTVFVAND